MAEAAETGKRAVPVCPKCGQAMVYVFRQHAEQDGLEMRTFECRHCETEITVHVLPDD